MKKIILGIDPGLRKTGWAIIMAQSRASLLYVASGVISTKQTDSDGIRLHKIFSSISDIIAKNEITSVAIENTYVNTNYASSLRLAHARAASIIACAHHQLEVSEYQAKSIKKMITGSGSAQKDQLMRALHLYLEDFDSRKLQSLDESDAIALAICHAVTSI